MRVALQRSVGKRAAYTPATFPPMDVPTMWNGLLFRRTLATNYSRDKVGKEQCPLEIIVTYGKLCFKSRK